MTSSSKASRRTTLSLITINTTSAVWLGSKLRLPPGKQSVRLRTRHEQLPSRLPSRRTNGSASSNFLLNPAGLKPCSIPDRLSSIPGRWMGSLLLSVERCLPSEVICYPVANYEQDYELSRMVCVFLYCLASSSLILYGMIQCIICSPGGKGLNLPEMALQRPGRVALNCLAFMIAGRGAA